MQFTWDPEKARTNLAKHDLSFEVATAVWDDPLHLIAPDRVQDGEQRWYAFGLVGPAAILVVIHVYPNPEDDELVRIVSARKATSHERRRYEQERI